MKPSPLRYHRPGSLAEALELLAEVGDTGKVLSGGQSLVPLLSMRLAAPAHVVDVNAVGGLDVVEVRDDAVHVGALVRHSGLEHHGGAAAALPLLRRALRHVAHPTIRNRGTTVGSIVHADPSGEMPAVLTLLGGRVVARSVAGEREIAASELFSGPLETTLRPDELVVGAVFPRPDAATGTAVAEVSRRHGDYAVAGVVVAVRVHDGLVAGVRACYVSAGELGTVVDLSSPLAGQDVSSADWGAAGEAAHELVETEGDIHASAGYRSQLVRVLTTRAVREAALEAADREEVA
jgi:carbon-monoxide dehydrogenase medium subunit